MKNKCRKNSMNYNLIYSSVKINHPQMIMAFKFYKIKEKSTIFVVNSQKIKYLLKLNRYQSSVLNGKNIFKQILK